MKVPRVVDKKPVPLDSPNDILHLYSLDNGRHHVDEEPCSQPGLYRW